MTDYRELEKSHDYHRSMMMNSWNNSSEISIYSCKGMNTGIGLLPDRKIYSDDPVYAKLSESSNVHGEERLSSPARKRRNILAKIHGYSSRNLLSIDNSSTENDDDQRSTQLPKTAIELRHSTRTNNDVDEGIGALGNPKTLTSKAVVEMCNRVYSVLGDIKCETTDLRDFETSKTGSPIKKRGQDIIKSRHSETFVTDELEDTGIMELTEISANSNLTMPSSSNNLPREHNDASKLQEALDDVLRDIMSRRNSEFIHKELYHKDDTTQRSPSTSGTLNRSLRIYRTLSQRIKQKFRPRQKTKESSSTSSTIFTGIRKADRIQELLKEFKIQQILLNQATKAVNVCYAMKEFTDSLERIESERLMLLADLRRKIIMDEIRRTTSNDNREDVRYSGDTAEITIKDMSLNLQTYFRGEFMEGEIMDWFVIVVTQGLKVWATDAISRSVKGSRINFPGCISIGNLTPNFKIVIEIYSLKLRKVTYNHEDKYHIHKHLKSTSCLPYTNIIGSPKKLFKKFGRASSSELHHDSIVNNVRTTSFVLSAFTELFLHDLSSTSSWQLTLVQVNSILKETIDMSLTWKFNLEIDHAGFVNHGEDNGFSVTWNRRWCILRGQTLTFWNYPREQDHKEPVAMIELNKCVTGKIAIADRKICAKSRTLLIETKRLTSTTKYDKYGFRVGHPFDGMVIKDFLSYDSIRELNVWLAKLNYVVSRLLDWKIIDNMSQPSLR